MFNVVIVEPEIPQNTGNISRTCVVTNTTLHLVRPFGFEISDRTLKRAGLDYWKDLNVFYYDSFEQVVELNKGARFFMASTHAKKNYADVMYKDGDFNVSRERYTHTYDARSKVAQSVQFRGNRTLRSTETNTVSRT